MASQAGNGANAPTITQRANKTTVEMSLGEPHLDFFKRAMSNVLSTELSEITYAQIIDGLPLTSVVRDTSNGGTSDKHPIYRSHKDLCPGVMEKAHKFRESFDLGSTQLDATLISDFRAASPGSRAFKMRLIELVAEAVHEIAVQLFNLGISLHTGDEISSWVPPKDDRFWDWFSEPWPTLFRHGWYVDHDQYPDGVADMVGFWAEARILGGVVLFDRRDPNRYPEARPDSVWFHSDRFGVPYRIYQLHDEQRQQLLEFLTSESPNLDILPILGDQTNDRREDPEEPIELTGIYRHKWERKPLSRDAGDRRLKDVWNQFEYPTMADWERAQERAYDRQERIGEEMQAEYRAELGL